MPLASRPRCACDVPAHAYQYSWNPNPAWSQMYAGAPEILQYLKDTVDKHDLRRHMRFGQECRGAAWDEASAQWTLDLAPTAAADGGETYQVRCHVFVYAVGRLNDWKLPDIPGLSSFEGRVIHTADWPRDTESIRGTVGVIGNGASAVQCLGKLREAGAREILNFVRSPTWLFPHVFSDNGQDQVPYSQDTVAANTSDPGHYYDFRLGIERRLARSFAPLWLGSSAQRRFADAASRHMEAHPPDPAMLAALRPTSFAAGCRRFTPATEYMRTLNQPGVRLVPSPIRRARGTALVTEDGESHPVHVLVCATGFDIYRPRFSVLGRRGHDLAALWSDGGDCESYLAVSVAHFPNFFAFNPPICPVNGSAYPGIERASDYMMRVIRRLQTDGLQSVCVKASAQRAFNGWVQSRMPEMVWSDDCSSWYKRNGKVIVPWPGTMLHYYAATEMVRWEDYDLRFQDETHRYASFGNGITEAGFDPETLPWLK
ncbi:hypothetical protein E4U53_004077 [Claviceps sorghi]|nr:hypothetical protein E4U53_004077 [Claviceps sorghi]